MEKIRIRDPRWKNFGSGIEKIRIRDGKFGSGMEKFRIRVSGINIPDPQH
jgi:hypothetical protein